MMNRMENRGIVRRPHGFLHVIGTKTLQLEEAHQRKGWSPLATYALPNQNRGLELNVTFFENNFLGCQSLYLSN